VGVAGRVRTWVALAGSAQNGRVSLVTSESCLLRRG
jgi:hypothetical protein